MGRPACGYKHRELFTDPTGPDSPSTKRAMEICEGCPIRRECAEKALTAGSSLDGGFTAAAVGVIQAGVYCDGTDRAAWELAGVAGVAPPVMRESAPRQQVGDRCKSCHRPMVRWHRGVTPEGYVMHRGRGYCTGCRAAYNAELKADRERNGEKPHLRKIIDRKRHTAPKRTAREVVVQYALFDREVLETT